MSELDTMTKRQRMVYEFIRDKIRNRGYGPTVREIGEQFGIASPNGVMCHLKALEKKGLITREPNMSRAIQLAVPLLDDDEDHRTRASSRSTRTSSFAASPGDPVIWCVSFARAGSARPTIVCIGCASGIATFRISFFLAAMMPFSVA